MTNVTAGEPLREKIDLNTTHRTGEDLESTTAEESGWPSWW
jgi:hypothetical protein